MPLHLQSSESPSTQRLNVAFLWHQHQPYYRVDDLNGKIVYQLPWVRLHAVKDYYDLPAHLIEFPTIRQTFNLVPSLLIQIQDYAERRATDTVIELTLKPPQQLTPEEKEQVLDLFFMANYERMIEPYDRYFRLLKKKLTESPFTDDEISDLQVWYNLCWVGEHWKNKEPFVSLFRKGANFTEEDKHALIDGHYKIMAEIIPLYRQLADSGQIECSISPYYHPILPLLINSRVAEISDPQGLQLEPPFDYPQDAEKQISRATEYYRSLFGYAPQGMWPSEGSVSKDACNLIHSAGYQWIATDQEILEHSSTDKNHLAHFTPYRFQTEKGALAIFFRDHGLSDAIGFHYAKLNSKEAAEDFILRLEKIRSQLLEKNFNPENCVVSVILDGENCWEFYESNGKPFLNALYRHLASSITLRTVTFSEFLRSHPIENLPEMTHLHPGSWIHHNFHIWIGGHPEENTAWSLLRETREWFQSQSLSGQFDVQMLEAAMEEILIAEGSDWFWWYGHDHWAHNKHLFDNLFRFHLRRVYTLLGFNPPAQLLKPIMSVELDTRSIRPASSRISPKLDGRISHFYEWRLAGLYEARRDSDTMNIADAWISRVFFGNDDEWLYIRVDFLDEKHLLFHPKSPYRLAIEFTEPISKQWLFPVESETTDIRSCLHDVFECAIPIQEITPHQEATAAFYVSIYEEGFERMRRPSRQPIRMTLIRDEDDRYAWSV